MGLSRLIDEHDDNLPPHYKTCKSCELKKKRIDHVSMIHSFLNGCSKLRQILL